MAKRPEDLQDHNSESPWSSNLMILEKIFANLELGDILSASLVSKSWCQGATKFLEKRVNPIIKNARQSARLKRALWRFRRHSKLTLDFNRKPDDGSLPVLLSSIENMPFLTILSLHFEATQATVYLVNGILAAMATGVFAAKLQLLELCPYGEANLSLNPNQGRTQEKEVGKITAMSSLEILKVRVGHLATLGLDWEFARHLMNLQVLYILELDFIAKYFGRQIQHFLDNFKENKFVNPLKMDVSFLWPQTREKDSARVSWPEDDKSALKALFDFVKPSDISLILLTPYALNRTGTKCRLMGFWKLVPFETLQRYSLHLQLSQADFQEDLSIIDHCHLGIAFTIRKASIINPAATVILSIDIDFGEGRKTFLEARKHPKGLQLSVRYGPKYGEEEQTLLHLWADSILATLNYRHRPVEDYRRRLESNPGNVGGKIKCSEIDTEQFQIDIDVEDVVLSNPRELPWREAAYSEPEPFLQELLTEETRYSRILEKNVSVSSCEVYSVR